MNPQYAYASSEAAWDEEAEQRMADMATFSDGLIHDVRNPLNVIKTSLYLLRQRLSSDDPGILRVLRRLDDQVAAQERLLDETQVVYRLSRPAFQRVDLNETVRRVVGSMALPEACAARFDLEPGLPSLRADPHLLEPSVRALVRNAVEALRAEGQILVRTGREGEILRLSVEDSGEGIPEDILQRVFEPLFTTRRAHGGLGLALVARTAKVHGGRAVVGSRVGVGTQVVLELPISTAS